MSVDFSTISPQYRTWDSYYIPAKEPAYIKAAKELEFALRLGENTLISDIYVNARDCVVFALKTGIDIEVFGEESCWARTYNSSGIKLFCSFRELMLFVTKGIG